MSEPFDKLHQWLCTPEGIATRQGIESQLWVAYQEGRKNGKKEATAAERERFEPVILAAIKMQQDVRHRYGMADDEPFSCVYMRDLEAAWMAATKEADDDPR